MKTRTELIYDFMLALSANQNMTEFGTKDDVALMIVQQAEALADAYLEIV